MPDSDSLFAAKGRRPVVAVVGCGRWGRNIVRDLVALGCVVAAVDESDEARRDAISLGASSAHQLLGDCASVARPDGVVVAAPTLVHARLGTEALELGVPVFVEKPLTDDVAAAEALVELGSDRLFVMHKWHYHPGIEALSQLVVSGTLGAVHGVTSERFGPANSSDTDIMWLLGPHEVTIGTRVHGGFPDRVEAVADQARVGLIGIDVIARWTDGRWHRWTISTRHEPHRRQVVVHGSEGHALLPGPYATHVEMHVGQGSIRGDEPRLVPVSSEPPLRRELRVFRDHLLGGPTPPTAGSDGLAVVRIIANARLSAGLSPSGSSLARPTDRDPGFPRG